VRRRRSCLIVGAQAALLLDYLDLAPESVVIEHEVLHAIGLERHHLGQAVGRHLLEVGGVILAGEGIVTPADRGDALVELARADVLRALEHHVLKARGDLP